MTGTLDGQMSTFYSLSSLSRYGRKSERVDSSGPENPHYLPEPEDATRDQRCIQNPNVDKSRPQMQKETGWTNSAEVRASGLALE